MRFHIIFLFIIHTLTNSLALSTLKANQCIKSDNSSTAELTSLSKDVVPSLEGKAKGDLGRIGVIGGSIEYTGAPYFSAISAFKVGADLVYVITTEDAAPIIKIYSPDLIVYPFLNKKHAPKINPLLSKMDAIIIGPGLGREEETMKLTYDIIESCKTLKKPLIIDADGLYAVSQNGSVLKGYPSPGAILTPNHREARKLKESVGDNDDWYKYWGDYVSVLIKGGVDQFHSSLSCYDWASSKGGSGRRAGGQGDILSGALGTFYNWALKSEVSKNKQHTQFSQSIASYAAAKLTRVCNARAYEIYGRSMLASDMIKEIHAAFDLTFQ